MPTCTRRWEGSSGWASAPRSWWGCGWAGARSPSSWSEGAFLGASRLLVDLPDRAHVIREVGDARHHPVQLGLGHVARRAEHLEPPARLVAEPVADLVPRARVDLADLPRLVPLCVREGVAALGGPTVHQRQPVALVLHVRG